LKIPQPEPKDYLELIKDGKKADEMIDENVPI
jgi:hypothetical protein